MHKVLRLRETVPAIELSGVSKVFATASGETVHALDNANLVVADDDRVSLAEGRPTQHLQGVGAEPDRQLLERG